jgi:carboxylesterase
MNQNGQLFAAEKWHEDVNKYQEAIEGGDTDRLELALSLANQEYHHHECEIVNAAAEQRSFCFQHDRITDTAILVMHGWTACPFEMRELGQQLHKQGFNVYGVRLAGHGTKVEDYAIYGQKDWEASAQKGLAITALMGRKVIVIGESMGGALAAILTATFPELVSKTILCAPSLWIADRKAEFSGLRLMKHIIPMVDFGDLPDWQKNYWYSKIPISGVAELIKVAHKARRVGKYILAPTLIIQAANDQMVNPKGAMRFYKTMTALAHPEKQLIIFKNGHHNLTVDLNPQKAQVFQWIADFIS